MINYDFSNLDGEGKKIDPNKKPTTGPNWGREFAERRPNGVTNPPGRSFLLKQKAKNNPLWITNPKGHRGHLFMYSAKDLYNTKWGDAQKPIDEEHLKRVYQRIRRAGKARGYLIQDPGRLMNIEDVYGKYKEKAYLIKAYSRTIKKESIATRTVIKDPKLQDVRHNYRVAPCCSNCFYFQTVDNNTNYGFCSLNKPKAALQYKTNSKSGRYSSLTDLSKYAALHGWTMVSETTLCDNWTIRSYKRNVVSMGKRLGVTFGKEGIAEDLQTTEPPLIQNINEGLLDPKNLLKVLYSDYLPYRNGSMSKLKKLDKDNYNVIVKKRKLYRNGAAYLLNKKPKEVGNRKSLHKDKETLKQEYLDKLKRLNKNRKI